MWEALLSSAMSGEGASSPAQTLGPAVVEYSGGITVSPVGVNFGEILKPFLENDTQNGGHGYSIPSRLASSGGELPQSKFNQAQSSVMTALTNPVILGVGLLAFLLLIKR